MWTSPTQIAFISDDWDNIFLVDNGNNFCYSLEYSKFSTVLECSAESLAAIYTDFVVTKTVEINTVLYQHMQLHIDRQ